MAPAPHLVQALQQARDLAAGREDPPGWRALEARSRRVLARLEEPVADPGYVDAGEAEGPVGETVDPDAADRAVASLTALQDEPDETQLELALTALTDLEDALAEAPGPGGHPGR